MKRNLLAAVLVVLTTASCGSLFQGKTPDYGEETVDIGYGSVRRRDMTGSASRVDVKSGSGYTDMYEYLRGRVAGVDVNGTTITIRGVRSILGSNEPLFLLDGVEISSLDGISPEDVDSVTVLKDASSTAAYGSRGANGVILIKTRRAVKD